MSEKNDSNDNPHDAKRQQEPAPIDQIPIPRQPAQPNQDQISNLEQEMSRAEAGMLRWNRVVAGLTFVLAAVGIFQAYSFVESERAFLVLKNIAFMTGEPVAGDAGTDGIVTITNVGKHVASISSLTDQSLAGIIHKTLPEVPPYATTATIAAPIPPNSDHSIIGHHAEEKDVFLSGSRDEISEDDMIKGINDGSIPLWIFGRIRYDIGFPWWRSGELGFCMQFVPKTKRAELHAAFVTCENPNYTYVR